MATMCKTNMAHFSKSIQFHIYKNQKPNIIKSIKLLEATACKN